MVRWTLRAFRDFVAELGAVDLGYTGYPFTWVNRRLLIKKKTGGLGMV